MGCRDCPRCTEPWFVWMVMVPFRFAGALLFGWNVGLVRRHCPQCRHLMAVHQRIAGRFVD
ncbi:MAG: hypothetical protein NVSMB14_10230 [Isosphaeraceae bacterium]